MNIELKSVASASTRAQQELYHFLRDKDDACRRVFNTTSHYNSILSLLAHSVGAEQRWVARIRGRAQPARIEESNLSNLSEIERQWSLQRDETTGIILGTVVEELHREISYSLPQWSIEGAMTLEETLYTVFIHEHYHRGQCSMQLQMLGFDPPNFDFLIWK